MHVDECRISSEIAGAVAGSAEPQFGNNGSDAKLGLGVPRNMQLNPLQFYEKASSV